LDNLNCASADGAKATQLAATRRKSSPLSPLQPINKISATLAIHFDVTNIPQPNSSNFRFINILSNKLSVCFNKQDIENSRK